MVSTSAMTHSHKRFWPGLIIPIIASTLLAAHFSRIQNDWLAVFALFFPCILFIRRGWAYWIFQLYLCVGGIIWIERAFYLRSIRLEDGQPWVRLMIILGVVALFTFAAALVLQRPKLRNRYTKIAELPPYHLSLIAFGVTSLLLTFIQFKVKPPILLLERFFPGAGMIEVVLLAVYAAWITEKMLASPDTSRLRSRIWLLFSIVFFAQFILGLSGVEKCMMTGKLHLPIPALIMAGPIYRGAGFFMPILFVSTVLLVGAAWCSHLCYIGSWDNSMARKRSKAQTLPKWWSFARLGILGMVILAALVLRYSGLGATLATIVAITYGIIGVLVMMLLSRHKGTMIHCTVYCPIGLVADIFGRINPFRIHFTPNCDDCSACSYVCRYNALTQVDIQKKRPGLSCTLCGDCLPACQKSALSYGFLGFSPTTARRIFLILIISLHAIFLGVARI